MHDALRGSRNERIPDQWLAAYAKLAASPLPAIRAEAHALALIFGDRAAADSLKRTAADSRAAPDDRRQALAALVEAHADGLAAVLQQLLDDSAMRSAALEGLAAYDDPRTPELILSHYRRFSPDEKRQAIDTLSARPSFAIALLNAIAAKADSGGRRFDPGRPADAKPQEPSD